MFSLFYVEPVSVQTSLIISTYFILWELYSWDLKYSE